MRTAVKGRAGRAGMTLVEVLVSLVILAGSLVAMGNFMGKFSQNQRFASLRQDEIDLATDLVDSVGHASTYASIPGYAGTTSITRDGATFSRVVTVKQIGGGPTSVVNYYLVTAAVSSTAMSAIANSTVKKSIAIRQF
ncbi:MAG TPA: prepilin-type N-terminal cleavage/methylation domain-containing protein [Gemmatimonadaceae bacterium]|nr:prepilin-type N-terminal cleavage/methylation domain-containing protein [Gemmatimonadaceae bacterium]